MATLLLRLAAPLQAWGSDSKFEVRRTEREPTKSGVIGLLAAALGIRRGEEERMRTLNRLRFGVRVDREGQLLVDYHTAATEEDRKKGITTYQTWRHYLSDAVFLAGLESDDTELLQELEQALKAPAFPLFLGRRSCPPTLPLCLGIRPCGLCAALESEPPLAEQRRGARLRMVVDASPGEKGAAFRRDLPITFSPLHRQYGYRAAKELVCVPVQSGTEEETDHDPFTELG